MDTLLAGYGSDSAESSSSDAAEKNDSDPPPANSKRNSPEKASAPLAGLLSVDSCSSSSEDEDGPSHPNKKQRWKKGATGSNEGRHETKQKISFWERNALPSPRTPAQSSSMVTWKTDYITCLRVGSSSSSTPPVAVTDPTDSSRFVEFEELVASRTFDAKTGWAAHLRNQNEFRNPHLLQSVTEEFGIGEPLGSRADDTRKTKTKQSRFH